MDLSTDISMAELHNRSGNEAFKAADFNTAYTNFSKAIKAADPKCAKYYTNRARASLKLKRYNRAYDDAVAALKLDPINVKAHYCKGEALLGKSNYELAQKEFKRALELMPGDADIQLKIDECKKLQFDKSVQQKDMQEVAQANTFKELQAMLSKGGPTPGPVDVASLNRDMAMISGTTPIVLEAHRNRDQKNYSKAIELYIKAADMGSAEAQYNLALMYLDGYGGQVNFAKSLFYLKKAASQPLFMAISNIPRLGVAEAHNCLGNHYRDGLGVDRDPFKAFEHYKISSEAGDVLGTSNLGLCYERGEGTPVDILKAIEMYTRAAERNWPIAQHNLGVIYADGYPGVVEKNVTLAREWLSKSAANNYHAAAVALAELEGFSLSALQAAAETGAMQAMYNLGVAYEEGIDMLEPNVEQALEWFKKAANKKSPQAHFRLGRLYLNKISSSSDPERIKKAVKSIREAARLDHPQAQFMLSEFYRYGDYGCKRDIVQADSLRKRAESRIELPDSLQLDEGDDSDEGFNKLIRRVQKWEQSQGLNDTEICNRDRIARYYKSRLQKFAEKSFDDQEHIKEYMEFFKVTEEAAQQPAPRPGKITDNNEKYSLEKLAPYANTEVGRVMIAAKHHHLQSLASLYEGKIDHFVHEWFQAIKLCDIVCSVPSIVIKEGPDILKNFIAKYPHNAEAKFILATIYLLTRRPLNILLPLFDDCIAINPQEAAFYIQRGSTMCFADKFKDAIPDFDNALRILGPKDGYQAQYMRAAAKRMEKEESYQQAALEDYRIYLDHAPPGDRKVPEALYGMAMCYMAMKDMEKMEEFYNRGLEAEANRLPIFGPLDFAPKSIVGSLIKMISARKFMKKPVDKVCPVCNESGKKLCGGCKKVWYCSKEHQKSDWKEHKCVCSKVSS